MSKAYKPYAFDREYATDGTVLRDGEKIKRVLIEEEAAERTRLAVEEALKTEEAQASQAAVDALKVLTGKIQILIARMDEESKHLREEAAMLATAAARKIAGKALEEYGEETIAECVKEAMRDLKSEPRVAISVAPHIADSIADRLYDAADRMGFEGAVVVRADEETATGDCSLEWRAGLIERTASDVEARIDQAVTNWLERSNNNGLAEDDDDTPYTTDTAMVSDGTAA